jgi:hypothetical protein
MGRGLAWAIVEATVGGEQHVPIARCPSAGDEHAPSMGPAWRVLPAAGRAPAHARCLPTLRARLPGLPRGSPWAQATGGTTHAQGHLWIVCMTNNIRWA